MNAEKIENGVYKIKKSRDQELQEQVDELLIMNLEQSMMINDLATITLGGGTDVVQ